MRRTTPLPARPPGPPSRPALPARLTAGLRATLPRVLLACALALGALLLPATGARAQGGPPSGGGWSVTDADGNQINPGGSGYPLVGDAATDTTELYPSLFLQLFNQDRYYRGVYCYTPDPGYGGSFYSGYYDYAAGQFVYGPGGTLDQPGGLGAGAYTSAGNSSGSQWEDTGTVGGVTTTAVMNGGVFQSTRWQGLEYWTWAGGGPPVDAGGNPLTHIDLLVTTSVRAAASVDYGASQQATGLSASASASDSLGDSLSAGDGDGASGSASPAPLTGRHLVRAALSGGRAEVYLSGTAVSSTSNSVPYFVPDAGSDAERPTGTTNGPTQASASASVTASAQLDDREVSISSNSGINFKQIVAGQLDANGDPIYTKAQHILDADGTMRGDVGLPYGTNSPSTNNYTGIAYVPHPVGGWIVPNSSYHWFSSLKQNADWGTLYSVNDLIPIYSVQYAQPQANQVTNDGPATITPGDTGSVDRIFLRYIDGADGATATANFYMTLHQPEEFTTSNKSTVLVPGLPANFYYQNVALTVSNPGYAIYPGGIPCTWNVPGAYWSYGSSGLAVLGTLGPPWLNAFLTAASISVNKLTPQANSGTAPWAWDAPDSTFPADHPKGSALQSFYHMTPMLHELYLMHYTLDDHYDINGYEGTDMITSSVDQGPAEWYGNFVYYVQQ